MNFERLIDGEYDSYHEQLRVITPPGGLRWVQSAVSLVTGLLVIARAVNILK